MFVIIYMRLRLDKMYIKNSDSSQKEIKFPYHEALNMFTFAYQKRSRKMMQLKYKYAFNMCWIVLFYIVNK